MELFLAQNGKAVRAMLTPHAEPMQMVPTSLAPAAAVLAAEQSALLAAVAGGGDEEMSFILFD